MAILGWVSLFFTLTLLYSGCNSEVTGCSTDGVQLRDMLRRVKTYQIAFGEPLVTDYTISEQWYSLGHYMLVDSNANLTSGACGTRYPIGIKAGVTVDWDSLDMNEVSLTATVFGRPTGYSEELEIRVRKCEDDIQYYLKPPKIQLAAYCFESLNGSTSNVTDDEDPPTFGGYYNYYGYYAIQSSLHFKEEVRNDVVYDVPYIVWTCSWRDLFYHFYNLDGIEFLSLSWFAENERIFWSRPQRINNLMNISYNETWDEAQITETDLLDAGYSMGVVIRCGIQVSRNEWGKWSSMITSTFDTSLFPSGRIGTISSLTSEENFIYVYNNVPLGCAAPVGTTYENCTLKLNAIIDDYTSLCSNISLKVGDISDDCGLTLVGLTKYGLETHSNSYRSWSVNRYRYDPQSGMDVYEDHGIQIQVESKSGKIEGGAIMYIDMAVVGNSVGHPFWDDYAARNLEITVSAAYEYSCYYWCTMRNELDIGLFSEGGSCDGSHHNLLNDFETPGKFIVLRGGQFPFSAEIEVELQNGVAQLCGITIRYGNDIYAYSTCGGTLVNGLIAGDGSYLPNIGYGRNIWIKELDLNLDFYNNDRYISEIYFNGHSNLTDSLEGFCAPGKNYMMGRDGKLHTDSLSLLSSWKIEFEESLSYPANQIQYSIRSNYYRCGCPANSEDVPKSVIVYEDSWTIHYKVYTGVLQCNLDDFCTTITQGKEWKKTLLPDYIINEVDIESKQSMDSAGIPALYFICRFHTVPEYLYKVQWLIDDTTIKEIGPAQALDQETFVLTDDDIYGIYGSEFSFDMKIQCSASVLDNDLNVLITPLLSEEFYPIQLPMSHITIQRGGDGTVTLKNNIPFVCTGGNKICEMGVQIYDPNDSYDCEDSTIAIKRGDSSDGKITATSSKPAVKGKEIRTVITSKNNDKYELKKDFELHIVVVFRGTGKSFWSGVLKTKVFVEIYEEPFWIGQSCHLHVDPHSKSMDGMYYENQNVDMFVLLRHLLLPIEVQTMTVPCGTGWGEWSPKCSCAIVIRAGADVYLINHCENKHFTGFLSSGDKIIKVYERDDTRYQIILPNTMMIEVHVMPYFDYLMNIDIYPSPSEMNNIEGLCGNFNGDRFDELTIRESSLQGNNDEFSLSWGLLSTDKWSESLLNQPNYQNPTPWSTKAKLCVWPEAATIYSDPICSADEEETCTKPKIHKGRKLNTSIRHKRDANKINLDIERRLNRLRTFIFEQHSIHRKRRTAAENVLNETYARTLCEEAFLSCPVSNISGKPVQEDKYLDDCIKDVAATGNIAWALPHCDALTARNEVALEKDVVFARDNEEVVTKMEKNCFSNCNGHGTCLDGVCHCDDGWEPPTCLLNSRKPVTITYITGDGQCDLSDDTCDEVVVETDGLVEEPQAKIDVRQAGKDGIFRNVDEFTKPASRISFNEAVVSLNGGRYRRSVPDEYLMAHQFGISVSNDGINFGNITYVTVLDTRCQETSSDTLGEKIVLLKVGFCYIDGVCYSEGTKSIINDCKICRPSVDLFGWTEENCTTVSPDTSLPTYVIILVVLVVFAIALISGLVVLRFVCKRRPVNPLPEPPPYSLRPEGPRNEHFCLNQLAIPGMKEENNKEKM